MNEDMEPLWRGRNSRSGTMVVCCLAVLPVKWFLASSYAKYLALKSVSDALLKPFFPERWRIKLKEEEDRGQEQ